MSPAPGLWVANRRGEHAGLVERVDGAYRATNSRGRELGVFDDLETAHAAIDGGSDGTRDLTRLATILLWSINAGAAAIVLLLASAFLR